ncbi:MAG: CoA ester lyase [Acidobacteria bacterium]|nr:CoA ester lyase [Acidobacteriota bacterium]
MIGPIRSMLFVPGTRHDRFAKAMAAGADAVVFDLEDSVEAGQKATARTRIAEFLATRRMEEIRPDATRSEALRLVRFNAVGTPDGETDLEFFSRASGFDGVLLPKVETAGAVELVAQAFARHAHLGAVPPLLLLIETPRAILRAADIAAADAPVAALLFGAEDLTASLAVERTTDGEELSFARAQIALAAAAVGADAIDAVFTDLNDAESLRRDCQRARAVGFRGKMAIHPKQVEVINEVFTPAAADVERARRLIDAYEAAQAVGQGVTTMDGRMVELPVVQRARRTLSLAAGHGAR